MSTTPRVAPANPNQPATLRSVMAHQPDVFDAFWSVYGAMWNDGVLDHPTKEIARIRNARTTDCGYCRQVRFSVAQEQGLTEDAIDGIVDGHEHGPLPPRTKAILRWVDAFLQDPARVDQVVRQDLQEFLGVGGEVELAYAIAMFRAFAKVLIVLGLEPEPGSMPISLHSTPGLQERRSAHALPL